VNQAAEHQARAVAATGVLSHGEFTGRMAEHGISGYRAENLAAGSDAVEDVIARWKASPGHNQNMLLPQVTLVGACARGHAWFWLGPLLGSCAIEWAVTERERPPAGSRASVLRGKRSVRCGTASCH
jgi:hypothetical protein